jgi:filamentous hemagglutinin family protein
MMSNVSTRLIWRAAVVSLALLAWQLCQRPACANPGGGTVVQGAASISSSGPQLTISTSGKTFIDWQSFNIGANETTTFIQPSSSSVVWNQIAGGSPSQILGSLNANGYVVLANPSGFYIGGQASIATHGLLMTTASIATPDVFSGGAWQFNAPPPTAKIVNYGQINIAGGGPAFLIADDIENNGTISAPGGKIGLYAGEKVLVSSSPDGRGLSTEVTLPQGAVDNQGKLIADAGGIALQAQTVNQGGLIEANSIQNVNGTIELVAGDSMNLGASSVISAQGDGASSGGTVIIKSENNFSDQAGSSINISGGAQGGDGGQVEISAPQMNAINSSINGSAAEGFIKGVLTIDPQDIFLTSSSSDPNAQYSGTVNYNDAPASGTLTLDVTAFASTLSQINLQAVDNIELSTVWNLADPGVAATLNLTAGNNIILDDGSAIIAGNNWTVNLTAGTQLPSGSLPASGSDGVYLNGSSYIQTQNGDINITAPNEVIVSDGAIRTRSGGNIAVTTEYGDVNTGDNVNGYTFGSRNAPYYSVNAANLGGISTAAGGNVTITAGGDVISYLPVQSDYADAQFDGGSGAFGSQAGNVTITAGGNVYGHYVLANGVGNITAGINVGVPLTDLNQNDAFALSLVAGAWTVDAPNGNIYVQDVRDPNGIFGERRGSSAASYAGYHYFDYNPLSSVLFDAGNSVEITGYDAPHTSASIGNGGIPIPIILPPSLTVIAGAGGFTLDTSVILFPSPEQNLDVTTLNGGNFSGIATGDPTTGDTVALEMSDSSATRWVNNDSYGTGDHAATPPELNNPNPVEISVSGSMEDVNLYTTKETQITAGGDMINSGLVGENLHPGDVTAINVTGRIFNSPLYSFVGLDSAIASANPSQPGQWDSVFELAINPSMVGQIDSFNANTAPGANGLAYYLKLNNYLLFPGSLGSANTYGINPGFIYDPSSQQLGFTGNMSASLSASQINALEGGTLTVLALNARGNPVIDPDGHLEVRTYNFSAASQIASLNQESLDDSSIENPELGYKIGGPGQFNVNAASINLGNSPGIQSYGFGNDGGADYSSLESVCGTLDSGGAAINVNVTGNLNMITSSINSIDGGDVNVNAGGEIDLSQGDFDFKTVQCYGIYTSGHSDVKVTADGDINIGSACIATFNGGNIFVESSGGDVNAGIGANKALLIYGFHIDPDTGLPAYVEFGDLTDPVSLQANPAPYGSGILAESPTGLYQTPGGNPLPGNITVETPNGNIVSSLGGISQFALDGSIAGGPTVTLTAGTSGTPGTPGQGNIKLGQGGVVGGTINIMAQGNVQGLIVSRQSANINVAESFSGTVLSGGTANLNAGGSISGTVVGIGGVSASGGAGVSATLLSQNVSVGGGSSQSTLGSSASATSASQSAAQQSSQSVNQQVATDETGQDDQKKKAPQLKYIKRVTVILPKSS